MASPLQLVRWTGKEFAVGGDAVEFLRGLPGPLVVVVMAGPYRSGKSFLLNRLAGRPGAGFRVDATTNACTKGIWVWGEALPLPDRDGSVLFLDTEGLGSTDRSSTEDSRIFALGLLLSSFFVYNSRGAIDTASLKQLDFVSKLTEHLRLSAAGSTDGGDAVRAFLPRFLWVLRDFTVQMKAGNKQLSPKEYLEKALSQGPEATQATRSQIKRFFPERECLDMPMPAKDADDMGALDSLPDDHLSDLFLRKVHVLRDNMVFKQAPSKKMDGVELDGGMLASVAATYVELVNREETPALGDTWQRVVRDRNEGAIAAALSAYEAAAAAAREQRATAAREAVAARLRELCSDVGASADGIDSLPETWPLDEAALLEAHWAALSDAKKRFDRGAIQDAAAMAAGRDVLQARAEEKLEKAREDNGEASRAACKATLAALHRLAQAQAQAQVPREDTAAESGDSAAASTQPLLRLVDQWEFVGAHYTALAAGPAAWEVLAREGAERRRADVRGAATAMEDAWRRQRRGAEERERGLREEVVSERAIREAQAAQVDQQRQVHEEQRQALAEAHEQRVAALDGEVARRDRDVEATRAQLERQSAEHAQSLERAREEVEGLRAERDAAARKAEQAAREGAAERERREREVREAREEGEERERPLRRRAEEAEARADSLAAKQAEAAAAFLREQEAVRKQFQEQRAALSREHDAEIARQQAREAEASRLRATVDKLGGVVREHLEDVAARLERAVGRGTESSAEAVEGLREAFADHAEAVKREAARGADAALKAAAEMREVQEARVLKLETEVEAERERREDAERDQHDRRQTVERMESAEQRVRDLEEQCSLAKQTIAEIRHSMQESQEELQDTQFQLAHAKSRRALAEEQVEEVQKAHEVLTSVARQLKSMLASRNKLDVRRFKDDERECLRNL